MAEPKPTYWQWRVRLKPDTPRDPWFSHKTWKKLRWRMTEADAAEWADKNGCEIEKVEAVRCIDRVGGGNLLCDA